MSQQQQQTAAKRDDFVFLYICDFVGPCIFYNLKIVIVSEENIVTNRLSGRLDWLMSSYA